MANISSNKINNKRQIGILGEEIAKRHLISKGYSVFEENYHVQAGEIDLICKKSGRLIFVEVKTRTSALFGYGEESFNWRKKQRLHRSILSYLSQRPIRGSWQIDLIVVELDTFNKKARVKHYEAVGL